MVAALALGHGCQHFDAHTWIEELENPPATFKEWNRVGETAKHKIFSLERQGKEEGQRMTSPRENSCLKSVKMNWGQREVETKEETENSTWTRHMVLVVEAESGMAIREAEATSDVGVVGSFGFLRGQFW